MTTDDVYWMVNTPQAFVQDYDVPDELVAENHHIMKGNKTYFQKVCQDNEICHLFAKSYSHCYNSAKVSC